MLALSDWIIIGIYAAIIAGLSVFLNRKAKGSLEDFFLGGRNVTWSVAGLSMVATTFAADTPLLVTELVRKDGISGNWLWWNMLLGGLLTTFFFARYWRRAGVLTDLELISLRYSGAGARFLRKFKALYFGFFYNVIILAWVNLAMQSILRVFFGLSDEEALLWTGALMAFTALYVMASGFRGVVANDVLQFGVAMGGCIALAILVVDSEAIGGIAGLKNALPKDTALSFLPRLTNESGALSLSWQEFVVYGGVMWWASWYPGNEPGGGGYIAQRMMAAESETGAIKSVFLFQLLHYAARPWPWIVVGLAAVVLYPNLAPDAYRDGFTLAINDYLPAGLRGLMLAAFAAAYMSTVSTHLNWGASYVANDLIKFSSNEVSERSLLFVSRILMLAFVPLALFASSSFVDISQAFHFLMSCGAGAGFALIARWYWWRLNAWSELTATLTPPFLYALFYAANEIGVMPFGDSFARDYLVIVFLTIAATILATYATRPAEHETLLAFYEKIKPAGFWPASIKADHFEAAVVNRKKLLALFVYWLASAGIVYGIMFAIGKSILQVWDEAALAWLIAIGLGFGLFLMEKKWKLLH